MWFRRDLRLEDHPALLAAAAAGPVLPVFVLDPALWDVAGPARRARLAASLRALDADLRDRGTRLVLRTGRPEDALPALVHATGARGVHVTADAAPYGRERDARVSGALEGSGAPLTPTGTPYAVGPGRVRNGSGDPYRVFTPFLRAWREHGRPAPASRPGDGVVEGVTWAGPPRSVTSAEIPGEPAAGLDLDEAGERAARRRWAAFGDGPLRAYDEARDRPALDGTSSLSAALKFGEIHPRTMLADLAHRRGHGADVFESELAWREFYADVLWHHPGSAREYLRPEFARMRYEEPGDAFDAWREGRTGYPFVDAGMRQLTREGWMHNRLRMVVASFLVKDLHVEWQHGARWFMRQLRDGDLASNSHGWQWTAGCGTDAAPYFRVFNPVSQGLRFDPDGAYVRRYVPELDHLDGAAAHEPWKHDDGYSRGYPARLVDHGAERAEALARYGEVKGGGTGGKTGGRHRTADVPS